MLIIRLFLYTRISQILLLSDNDLVDVIDSNSSTQKLETGETDLCHLKDI